MEKFVDNGDGTVTDITTGLMWQKATAPKSFAWWYGATVYCGELRLSGHSDWRLPTSEELLTLADKSRGCPAINTDYFPDTVLSGYWTCITSPFETQGARVVYYKNGGYDGGHHRYGSHHVRAVRTAKPLVNA